VFSRFYCINPYKKGPHLSLHIPVPSCYKGRSYGISVSEYEKHRVKTHKPVIICRHKYSGFVLSPRISQISKPKASLKNTTKFFGEKSTVYVRKPGKLKRKKNILQYSQYSRLGWFLIPGTKNGLEYCLKSFTQLLKDDLHYSISVSYCIYSFIK
jgi:hypothetical protein